MRDTLLNHLFWILTVLPCTQAGSGPFEQFWRQSGSSCLVPSAIPQSSGGAVGAGSSTECAQWCVRQSWCVAFVLLAVHRHCHLLSDVTELTGSCLPGSGIGGWQTWVRDSAMESLPTPPSGPQCQNGGVEKAAGGCQCFFGYVGDHCERLAEDCREIDKSGHYQFSSFTLLTIRPALSPHNMTVLCRANGHTVVLKQDYVYPNGLNVTWEEYVEGFAPIPTADAYWMGLRNLFYISNSKAYRMVVFLRLMNATLQHIWYSSFKLTDDVDFTAQLGSFQSGPAGMDLLDDINGNPFSTYDHSHGNSNYTSCALGKGGGWWFGPSCASAGYNLVGEMREVVAGTDAAGYFSYGPVLPSAIKRFTVALAK